MIAVSIFKINKMIEQRTEILIKIVSGEWSCMVTNNFSTDPL